MPGEVVMPAICFARKARQNPSSHHGCVGFGHTERGSECCWLSQRGSECSWLSQRGSNWVQSSALPS